MWQGPEYRIDLYHVTPGAHIDTYVFVNKLVSTEFLINIKSLGSKYGAGFDTASNKKLVPGVVSWVKVAGA